MDTLTLNILIGTMPFYSLHFPDLAAGTLKSIFNGFDHYRAQCRYFNLEFKNFVSYEEYDEIIESNITDLYADFLVAPFLSSRWDSAQEARYAELVSHSQECRTTSSGSNHIATSARNVHALRNHLRDFVDAVAKEPSWSAFDVLILNAKYMNLLASVFLAKRIKTNFPHVKIMIFGELLLDSAQEREYSNLYPFVDAFLSSADIDQIVAQIRTWNKEENFQISRKRDLVPDYEEYFLSSDDSTESVLLVETSRGCWWYDCKFCSSRGSRRKTFQRSPREVSNEIRILTERYQILRFELTDVCINPKFIGPFLSELGEQHDFEFFAEVRSDLSFDHLLALYQAGVRTVQVGIESFSTDLLRRIEKGATCLENILFLRSAAEIGISVIWNLMYGFPEEDDSDYLFSADVMSALHHLPCPANLIALRGERSSGYHHAGTCHLPLPIYSIIYPDVPEHRLSQICSYFQITKSEPQERCISDLRTAYLRWVEAGRASLTLRYGPDFVLIRDARDSSRTCDFTLTGWQGRLYVFCRQVRKVSEVLDYTENNFGVKTAVAREFLSYLQAAKLVVVDRDEILSLATRSRTNGGIQ